MKYFPPLTILFMLFLAQCSGTQIVSDFDNDTEEEIEIDIEADHEEIEVEEDLSMFIFEPDEELPVTTFPEIWGYVIAGQEAALRRGYPISDVGYFGAEVNRYGELANVPNRQNLSGFSGRVHLTVTCFNYALSYFVLLPGSYQRSALIDQLVNAARNFDGLNIDFENIPARSAEAFLSFLHELRERLPGKILSVCLYGRSRAVANDVYDYALIAPYVDKIFVMGYDQHWSGGPAGPIASLQWGRSVVNHSLNTIGREKLVMGIPLYGRAWADANHHRALIYSTSQRLIENHNAEVRRENGIPTFNYNVNIGVRVYFEDEYSLSSRMEMYKSMNVRAIGFWRLGQETPRMWNILRLES